MSDAIAGRQGPSPLVLGIALGLVGAGVVALLTGALYDLGAALGTHWFPLTLHDIEWVLGDPGDWLRFVPVPITVICGVALLGRRRRIATVVLALFSAAGIAALLLRSDWGGGIVDASPEATRRYNQFTYAGDLLFCFAHAVQLAASLLLLLVGGGSRRGDRR